MIIIVLWEIKYYQSNALNEYNMILYKRFKLFIKEIIQDIKNEILNHFYENYKFEKNIIIALQIIIKYILIIFFEMIYILR